MENHYKNVFHLFNSRGLLLVILIILQTFSMISNIIVIKVMRASRSTSPLSSSKRPNILMTNIATSGLLVIIDFFLPIFIIVPGLNLLNPKLNLYIQSLVNYTNALSLYVVSFSMAFLSLEQYFSLTRVFNNPLDKISTCSLVKSIWLSSALFSIFFVVTNDVYYFNYKNYSLICSHYENYMKGLSDNRQFRASSTIIRIVLQYILPALTIFTFSMKTITHLISNSFRNSENSYHFSLIFRLLSIFLIFILTNSAFHMNSIRNLVYNLRYDKQVPCSVNAKNWLSYYLFLLTCQLYPVIYFWFSKHFRKLFCTHFFYHDTLPLQTNQGHINRDNQPS